MMKKSEPKARCPTCRTVFYWDEGSPWRPFCSERCRLIDLGDWLEEGHRITGDSEHPALFPQPDE